MFNFVVSFLITFFSYIFPTPPVTSPFVAETNVGTTTLDLLIQNPVADQDAFEINTFNPLTSAWRVEPFVLYNGPNQVTTTIRNLRPNSFQTLRVRSFSWTRPPSSWVIIQTRTH